MRQRVTDRLRYVAATPRYHVVAMISRYRYCLWSHAMSPLRACRDARLPHSAMPPCARGDGARVRRAIIIVRECYVALARVCQMSDAILCASDDKYTYYFAAQRYALHRLRYFARRAMPRYSAKMTPSGYSAQECATL